VQALPRKQVMYSIWPSGRCLKEAPFIFWHWFVLAGNAESAIVNRDHVGSSKEFSS
jgi:hypothetical protein